MLFTEPLACCVRNIDRLPLLRGDAVLVVGLGSIGLMMASLLHLQGVKVLGLDLDSVRCKNSLNYGVDKALSSADGHEFAESLEKLSEGRKLDGVIFTAGPAAMLGKSLIWIRDGGFINLFSHLSGESASIDVAQIYHRELQIIATYSSSPASLRKAFSLLRDHNLGLARMISGQYGLEDLEKAVSDINQRKTLKALIVPNPLASPELKP